MAIAWSATNPSLLAQPESVQVEDQSAKPGKGGDDSLNLRYVGSWPFGPADPVAADSARNLLFLGSGGGVLVLDISDPGAPRCISDVIRTSSTVLGLYYDPVLLRLYIAAQSEGLGIWDLAEPTRPVRLGGLAWVGVQDVTRAGDLAYLATRAGLVIVDVANPANPMLVGTNDSLGFARSVVVHQGYAYLAANDPGFVVVDVQDPARPVEFGRCSTLASGTDVALKESLAFVTSYDGLAAIDVRNPAQPI
ncbi:MAG: hypothetical protein ABIK62_02675, partial [candidate division WOR-3 bacterium]